MLEERDGSCMIVDTVNDKVEYGFGRRQQVRLQLELRDDGYTFEGWFTVSDVKGFDMFLRKCWVHNIN